VLALAPALMLNPILKLLKPPRPLASARGLGVGGIWDQFRVFVVVN